MRTLHQHHFIAKRNKKCQKAAFIVQIDGVVIDKFFHRIHGCRPLGGPLVVMRVFSMAIMFV
ncbi:hypothetical protein [Streptosporangium canum]|uniref:hypothetical protein n=1 Tax=Streptosporangium canum TaxID=324952 RepID=UPI0037A1A426